MSKKMSTNGFDDRTEVRLTSKDKQELERVAKAKGMSVSALIRMWALDKLKGESKK